MRRFSSLALALRRRALGLVGSRRRRPLVLATIASLAALAAFLVSSALAVHDTGRFQLDGNALTSEPSTPTAKDDWDKVCHQEIEPTGSGTKCTIGENTTEATAVSWEAEPNLSSTIFTGGGSKDPQPISNWLWKDEAGGLPDKDNLLHSFAARYSLENDLNEPEVADTVCEGTPRCELLVFGSDRYDNSGDAQQGFWFFQKEITDEGTPTKGGTGFTGNHENGDLLVISDFSNGGTTSTISVYKWDETCEKGVTNPKPGQCGDTNLRLLATSTKANCATASAGDSFCGIVNAKTVASPWEFKDKSGSTKFLNGEFYEGGINLSALGLGGECFASVASETRSSTSTTATLKDFVLANFGKCESGTTTTPVLAEGSNPPITEALTIPTQKEEDEEVRGPIEVKDKAEITVSGTSSFEGTVSFYLCGPLESEALCEEGGVALGEEPVEASGTFYSETAKITEAGRYCWRAVFSGDEGKNVPGSSDSSETECFQVEPVEPEITTKAGAAVYLGEKVTDTGTLAGTAREPGTEGPEGSDGSINPETAGETAKGEITFTLYKLTSNTCGEKATSSVLGEENPQTKNVSGDGKYEVSFTPNEAGTYVWVAEYSGDPPNTKEAGPSECSDANEAVEVIQTATQIKTKQSWIPQDTAEVSSESSSNPLAKGGKVTFSLFGNSTCTGTVLFEEEQEVEGGGTSEVLSTENSGVEPNGFTITTGYEDPADSSKSYSWKVVYEPGEEDTSHTGTESSCEHFTTTYTNDPGPQPAGAAAIRATAVTAPSAAAPAATAPVAQGSVRQRHHRRHRIHRHLRHHLRVHR